MTKKRQRGICRAVTGCVKTCPMRVARLPTAAPALAGSQQQLHSKRSICFFCFVMLFVSRTACGGAAVGSRATAMGKVRALNQTPRQIAHLPRCCYIRKRKNERRHAHFFVAGWCRAAEPRQVGGCSSFLSLLFFALPPRQRTRVGAGGMLVGGRPGAPPPRHSPPAGHAAGAGGAFVFFFFFFLFLYSTLTLLFFYLLFSSLLSVTM